MSLNSMLQGPLSVSEIILRDATIPKELTKTETAAGELLAAAFETLRFCLHECWRFSLFVRPIRLLGLLMLVINELAGLLIERG